MTRLKLVAPLALLMMFGLTGCATRHIAVPNGATGIYLGKGKVAFPDSKGTLAPGSYEPEAGDLIRRPKDEKELIETLRAAGVKIDAPQKD